MGLENTLASLQALINMEALMGLSGSSYDPGPV